MAANKKRETSPETVEVADTAAHDEAINANIHENIYDAGRETDEFRGNINNYRVAMRRAAEGDVGLEPDAGRAKALASMADSVVVGAAPTVAGETVPMNSLPTTTTPPAGTTADPTGKTAPVVNAAPVGNGAGNGGWTANPSA